MPTGTDVKHSKFQALLQDQIRHDLNIEHQYRSIAAWFDNADLPVLAGYFYRQAVTERNHAMMIARYLMDHDISVDWRGIDSAKSTFSSAEEAVTLAATIERETTAQIVNLAAAAREGGDYQGEQFTQWFLKEQQRELATMTTLVVVAKRAAGNMFDLEEFVSREMSGPKDASGAPSAAGGTL
ncbi:ferritin [Nocardia sp. NPDC005978]|uniref:ferritin n=1 Tax=unclassified Nocardia TaxID=2637762 RepID=UPI0033B71B64